MPGTHTTRLWFPAALFGLTAVVIASAWWWMGGVVPMPAATMTPGEKLYCVSYAPFREGQTPLNSTTRIEAWQIEEDLARLSKLTDCVRTYAVELGLDQVPEIAKRHGMQVIQGLWLGSKPEKNAFEVATVIELAKKYPETIRSIVVGNEVLLRGEMSAADLANTIRGVKARVTMPVTYADVWEFWLRYRDVYDAVDFVTIHILPYWEDFPIPAEIGAAHVDSIRKKVAATFPDKEVLIGETGWPSRGRMREGALPSPVNQARFFHEVIGLSKREGFHVNLIEAFDQPWKRALEGTAGGHWGLLDARTREFKFEWGQRLSNHAFWRWQLAGGILLAGLVFAACAMMQQRASGISAMQWLGIAVNAAAGGIFVGLAIENVPLESLGIGGWVRSVALAGIAFAAPLAASVALIRQVPVPSFSQILARADQRLKDPFSLLVGMTLIGVALLALQVALGLVFDPRYRDFPYAPLTAAMEPFMVLAVFAPRGVGSRPVAELAAAATLAVSAIYIALNESFVNWQALWIAAILMAFSITLFRVRDAQG